jgi:6-phosphogluconolactonase
MGKLALHLPEERVFTTGDSRMAPFSLRLCLLGLGVLLLVLSPAAAADAAKVDKYRVYIGTYTGKGSKGIYRCELDLSTGKLSQPELAGEVVSPSFLALHPSGKFLYAVGEINDFQGKKAGAVSAFAIDPASGNLTLLNQQSSKGDGPCHLVVDKAGKNVLVANYGGGSAAVLPIAADGKLGEASSFVQHEGKSINKQRQGEPHAHSINLDAANHFAFVADLGLDKVLIYKFDADKGSIAKNDPPAANVEPGSGPRHFAFHPNGRHAYVINELANMVTVLSYDPERGALTPIQTETTLPEGLSKTSYCAEVVVHPSGNFLYGSNRGHDSIAVFAIDSEGRLAAKGHQGEGIKTPRNFNIDPTGHWMLVANQGSNSVIVFAIDPKTGALTPTGNKVEVGQPVCIRFLAIGR